MHVMAQNAVERSKACTGCNQIFGIVFDAKYHFGVEGAYAFDQAIKRLTGKDIDGYDPSLKNCNVRFCGIQPQKPSYASEAQSFNDNCYQTTRCDFVAFLLEPDTALSFISEGRPAQPQMAPDGFGLAQPLFTRDFAENCKTLCDGMWVWTGYNPPIEALANTPGVAKFVSEIHNESASADVTNQFLEGGYLGMSLMMAALQKTGPTLTRAALRNVLDSMTFDTGLSSPLTWKSGNHFANTSAQAFSIQYKQNFNGWRQVTGFVGDPWVGQDIPSGE
jgi:ABC-type branched-subunit amino acid transport system substrate-binding protein